jgi:PHD/YefM family antitoxin component YafN of YafNO toxin-antitoxin module
MTGGSIVSVTEARKRLNKLIKSGSFAISRHGKIAGVYLSRKRIEALIETMELLSKPEFATALNEYASGRMKLYSAAGLGKAMSR